MKVSKNFSLDLEVIQELKLYQQTTKQSPSQLVNNYLRHFFELNKREIKK